MTFLTISHLQNFIDKANKIHNHKYDYSKVIYKNNHIKVELICPIHEIFWQRPNNHLTGHGCPKCGIEILKNNFSSNKKEFINKAQNIHGLKYDYSRAEYKHSKDKVEIICVKHGSFFQTPNNHLKEKHGCPKCGIVLRTNKRKLSKKEFIKKAKEIHENDEFDYSKVSYENNHTKVEIICLKHGSWFQTPNNHLRGQKCPKCFHIISNPETQWLDKQKIPKNYRQYSIKLSNKTFKVDGFNPISNTVYEFLGDYWHGNPKIYKSADLNKKINKTFGVLYQETIDRIELFKTNGYNVIHIWESEYK